MKPGIENHPALRLGEFLKDQRIGAGLTLRIAAKWMEIKPSVLSELERGIGDHMTERVADELATCYRMTRSDERALDDLIVEVGDTEILGISDIYDVEDVLPAFIPLTPKQREKLLGILGFKE